MEEYIVWFEISMDDRLTMKIADSLAYLIHDICWLDLTDGVDSFLDGLAQVIVKRTFHDNVKM